MASLLTHGFVAVQLGRAAPLEAKPKRLWLCAIALSLAPDLDLVTLPLNVPDESPWFHGGVTHSLLLGAVLAGAVAWVGFRRSADFRKIALLLLAAIASHDLIDAMVVAGPGAALFAPLSRARLLLPLTPLVASPFGAIDAFGRVWLWMLANEVLVVWLPVTIFAELTRARRSWRVAGALTGLWLAAMAVALTRVPQVIGHREPRRISGWAQAAELQHLDHIPVDGIPGGARVTRYPELAARGVFDRELVPDLDRPPWSSSFFPFWYGGIAGRWQDPAPRLVWRTLASFPAVDARRSAELLEAADRGDAEAARTLFRLSPTEKYDLAVGDDTFSSSRFTLADTHNARPRAGFSEGLCNAVAAASLVNDEPYRTVDVLTPSGHRVRFHPNDVKALLAVAWNHTERAMLLGGRCDAVAYDTGALCSLNPASLVLGLANRVGLARRSVLVQVHPSIRWQYYALASARLHVARGPYPPGEAPLAPELAGPTRSLVDVEVDARLSSTVLPYRAANVLDPAFPDGTAYRRVGVEPVGFHWAATLALDEEGEILGGVWTGALGSGPNQLHFSDGPPKLTPHGFVDDNPFLQFEVIHQLALASVDPRPARPPLDLRALCAQVACSPPFRLPASAR